MTIGGGWGCSIFEFFFVFPLCVLVVIEFDRVVTSFKIGVKLFSVRGTLIIESNFEDMELIVNPLELTEIVMSHKVE